jgi:hypothetical protein
LFARGVLADPELLPFFQLVQWERVEVVVFEFKLPHSLWISETFDILANKLCLLIWLLAIFAFCLWQHIDDPNASRLFASPLELSQWLWVWLAIRILLIAKQAHLIIDRNPMVLGVTANVRLATQEFVVFHILLHGLNLLEGGRTCRCVVFEVVIELLEELSHLLVCLL